jgi:hypothetical protein
VALATRVSYRLERMTSELESPSQPRAASREPRRRCQVSTGGVGAQYDDARRPFGGCTRTGRRTCQLPIGALGMTVGGRVGTVR